MYSNNVTQFARADYRNPNQIFGIKDEDRFSHVYIIGKTGTGKSTLIETMALQDIKRGQGLALIDPHGDLVERIAAKVPSRREADVIYLNAADRSQPYGYNPLRHVREDRIAVAASGFIEVFKMWPDAWGVRMEHILRNVLMALLEQPHATMHDVLRMLSDRKFRADIARRLKNETVRNFFLKEFDRFSFGYRADGAAPIQNKVGAFLSDPVLNRLLTAPMHDLHVRQIMDEGRVLLVNLAKGRIGEDTSSLLGGLLVTTLGLAAFSRAELPEHERCDFYVYVDEFQNFTTLAMANMFSELRKYRVGFTVAHQYLHQLEPDVRHAVLGNAGTIISFRVGSEDATYLAREFQERFEEVDLLQLPNYRIYLKLMIDGMPSRPFSATTLAPTFSDECFSSSRE
ncbi:type IV secretory system conjugative DNA transfer family protein [Bradyrhizobium elkanii]|uniref:Energy-coupling factor transporter ATP-binding protein EcfA2 n=1 Tax=Bradyrhizobium elkanii TaxID=29448 RepID=A0ABV4FAE0_BRAEL|nr:type IV secretion system DNA-binding domain-containing protein [Bradyrhizobium elkanii]MCP1751999.1 energy-coupling factor transporter ATP-binding protein EcfA2 [Bradyrhizobium elkanii]MCP1977770.1 energy-coupling factor transporter ATP-binding protein EcfA2 [Bradyrhizobium elkanii]MCS3887713.1 energy-coupling factor transporter ATP-binding protein EcfA2 [Bradyrhizobium elkanii]MCS4213268.1 energy-coupling factor transporter ATP-binding protein EcfA2 [Bradyrhizobium elkanii]MCW2213575.1 ene